MDQDLLQDGIVLKNSFYFSYAYQQRFRRSNANGPVLGDYANFNAPRTIGVEATVNF